MYFHRIEQCLTGGNFDLFFGSLQELVHAKDPPSHYLNKLSTYLDPRASRSAKVSDLPRRPLTAVPISVSCDPRSL